MKKLAIFGGEPLFGDGLPDRVKEITKWPIITEGDVTKWDVEGSSFDVVTTQPENASFRDPGKITLENHKLQISDLIDAINNDRAPLVDVYEGRKTVDIILGAYQSSNTKKVVFI